jgi:predicted Ser/Thr protein kinase
MHRLVTCPQGHQWELAESASAPTAELRILCPVCGVSVDLGNNASEESRSEAATMPPAQAPGGEGSIRPEGAKPPPIPGYEILEQLGRGGMGVVFKARQTRLDRLVALKVLPEQTARDPAFAERFSREARALARLNHPGIVAVHDFGQVDGRSYLVMEYVDGVNLRQRLQAGRLTLADIMQMIAQLCDALQYAHDQGIVHRDIKPENVLLDPKGRVRIADFGIARLLARQTSDYTLTGPWQVMGTLHYMAPEQIENPQAVDHRADIYSLGVILYEMLTGELPLGRFALPSQKTPLDPRLDEVVMRALAREPERRYQHAAEFRAALEAVAGRGRPAIEPDSASPAPSQPAPAQRPIAVLLLTALAVVFWPVGLALAVPTGIWLWLVLRRPDGKAELRRHVDRAESLLRAAASRYLAPVVATTTGWAIIVCLLGAAATLQPLRPIMQIQDLAVAVIFITLLLLLLATSFMNPIPLWRPVVIMLAAAAILIVIGHAIRSSDPAQPMSRARPILAAYTVMALSFALLLLGTIQLRGVLQVRHSRPQSS